MLKPQNVPSRRNVFPTSWDYMSWELRKLRWNHKKKRKQKQQSLLSNPPKRSLKKGFVPFSRELCAFARQMEVDAVPSNKILLDVAESGNKENITEKEAS